jgi:hypothetical protein
MTIRGTYRPIVWAGTAVTAMAGVFAIFMAASAVQTSPNIEHQETPHLEEKDAPKPNEIAFRTGIPMLMAIEMPHLETLYYHEISVGDYDFLDRTVQKGAALISNSEMDFYFNTFSDKGNRFAFTSKNGVTQYYSIDYFEPPLSLDHHYVNALLYAPSDSITDILTQEAKSLPLVEKPYLMNAIVSPYRWTQIDEVSASQLLAILNTEGKTFNVFSEGENKTVRLMYVGPFSDELNRPEFQSMYNLSSNKTESQ